MPKVSKAWARGLWLLAVTASLGAVFGLYLQPDFLIQLSNQLWACF